MTKTCTGANPKASRPPVGSQVASGGPRSFGRRAMLLGLGAVAAVGGGAVLWTGSSAAAAEEVVVYKDPSCDCCGRWAAHMRRNGFTVVVKDVEDIGSVKREAGIPEALESCHTAHVGGYVVEGHVPAADIRRMLSERLAIRGLAVPGMPSSAPGMDNPTAEPYVVFAFDASGGASVFASH